MKKVFIFLMFIALSFSVISIVRAGELFPTISTACELKNGQLFAMDDGFSVFKKCEGNSRRIVLLGEKGEIGDRGPQGETGLQGIRGEQGETGPQGFSPVATDITIFTISNLSHDQYSEIHDLTGHQMITLSCLFEGGGGGIWVYHSDDQQVWELDYMAGCSGNSNDGYKQTISTVKGNYYKFKVVNSFYGEIKAIAY